MLIRRKSSTYDEYHHDDLVGVFGVLTNATGSMVQNNISDAYGVPQYVEQNSQVLSRQIAVCMMALAEPDMQSSLSGTSCCFPARALNLNSQTSFQHNKCLKKKKGTLWHACMILCETARAITCDEMPFVLKWLCKLAIGAYCRHYCNNINNWNPWPDHCTSHCKNSPTGHCIDCCNSNCKSKGSTAKCYNMSNTR